ncbi:phytanoyl-CoA dioxygenase family protein [Amycolatopsis sp. NPDC051128]|uniref:phytanoyl-CoA dioxygenase family protein n=1 Tax=Amycolatopsis sp. NPDC051128 TaxID=3155412 RepID=UPI0034349093
MSESFKTAFANDGYAVAWGLFAEPEVDSLREHFMTLRRRKSYADDVVGVQPDSRDPLRRYPRMAQMHRWDDVTLRWLLDHRLADILTLLLGAEPYAVQSMLYFKPAGARGQALHQDNFYLRAEPGTCVAAWMALDPADDDNGCMMMVPGSHRWPILCTENADTRISFTDVTVPLAGHEAVPVHMAPGDVLFFNGSMVHGSRPNTSADRFRRSLIGHYIEGETRQVAEYYHPALRMDGTPLRLEVSEGGGACGEWVEHDGERLVAMTGTHTVTRRHE